MHVQNKIRIKFVSGTEKVIRRSMTRGYWEVVCFFAKCVSPKLERTARMAYGATKLLLNEDVAKGLFFHNGNTVSLYNRMDSREKRDFPCIWGPQYSWDKYTPIFLEGVKITQVRDKKDAKLKCAPVARPVSRGRDLRSRSQETEADSVDSHSDPVSKSYSTFYKRDTFKKIDE